MERTFVGDHNYSTPDRNLGVNLAGDALDKKFQWAVAGAAADIDPDAAKLDFDTPVNPNSDFNQGWMFGGRIDYHPLGNLKMSQGDFNREPKLTVGAAAFTWSNDDDNNTRTEAGNDTSGGSKPDVDKVTGIELSGAFRGWGLSVDTEYNRFSAETVDGNVTAGIYKGGDTDLWNFAVEGGYMVWPKTVELVGSYQMQDADGYGKKWTRYEVGANWFIVKKHDIKLQATYRANQNEDGVDGDDPKELFIQAQYVF